MNYFRKEFPIDRVHRAVDHQNPGPRWTGRGRRHRAHQSFGLRPLRCPRVLAKGRERESGVRGVRWAAHQGTSGGVAAGHRDGAVVVRKTQW
jgi:hypothetical protein